MKNQTELTGDLKERFPGRETSKCTSRNALACRVRPVWLERSEPREKYQDDTEEVNKSRQNLDLVAHSKEFDF